MTDPRSWYERADKLADDGVHKQEARQLLDRATAAGYGPALLRLAVFLWDQSGQERKDVLEEVETLLERAVDEGVPGAANYWGNVLADIGQGDRAEQLYRRAIAEGDTDAPTNLAGVLHDRGADLAAFTVLVSAAKGGNDFAHQILSSNLDHSDPMWAEITDAWSAARPKDELPGMYCYRPGTWDLDLSDR